MGTQLQDEVKQRMQCFQLQNALDLCLENTGGTPKIPIEHAQDPCVLSAAGFSLRGVDLTPDQAKKRGDHILTLCDFMKPPPKAYSPGIYSAIAFLDTGIFPWTMSDPTNASATDIGGYWNTAVVSFCENHLDVLADTADFTTTSLLRLLYLHGTVPPHWQPPADPPPWRDPNNLARNPNLPDWVESKILDSLRNFKYWMDEPFRVQSAPDDFNKLRDAQSPPIDHDVDMTYWSENHQILFAASEYLVGQLMPGEYFPKGKMSGYQHQSKAYMRVRWWLEDRLRYGFSEFNSPGYYEEDICALLNLVDFCLDDNLRNMASMVLDLLIFDLARFNHKGHFGAAAGRAYFEHKSCLWDQDTRDASEILFGDTGIFVTGSDCANALASSRRYDIPDVLIAIGQDVQRGGVDRSRVSIKFEEAPQRYADVKHNDDAVIFWWEHLAYFYNDDMTDASYRVAKKYGIDETDPFEVASTTGEYITVAELAGLMSVVGVAALLYIPLGGNPFSSSNNAEKVAAFARGSSLTRANLYTYRNAHAMLSSIQNFNSGTVNAQTQYCQATLDGGTTVWTTHAAQLGGSTQAAAVGGALGAAVGSAIAGGVIGGAVIGGIVGGVIGGVGSSKAVFGHDGPNYWTGSASAPRVVQKFGAAIIAYHPEAFQLAIFGDMYHAWFPKAMFDTDSIVQDGNWFFGSVGDGYVGLYSAQDPEWGDSSDYPDKEIKASGERQIFIIQVGDKEEFGSYDNFKRLVGAARIHINGLHWPPGDFECSYDIPLRDRLELHWDDNEVRYAGQQFDDDNFPRFEGPYCNAQWGATSYTISFGGFSLTHDFGSTDSVDRSGDGVASQVTSITVKPI